MRKNETEKVGSTNNEISNEVANPYGLDSSKMLPTQKQLAQITIEIKANLIQSRTVLRKLIYIEV